MSSPNGVAQATEEQRQTSESAAAALESAPEAVTSELLDEHDELEAVWRPSLRSVPVCQALMAE